MFRVDQVCKWTTRSSLDEAGVQLGQDVSWGEGGGGRGVVLVRLFTTIGDIFCINPKF